MDAQIYLADTRDEIRLDVYHQAEAVFEEARRRAGNQKGAEAGDAQAGPPPDGGASHGRLRTVVRRS